MPHLVCGCCHGSTVVPIGLAAPRRSRRDATGSHGRPAAGASRSSANPGVQDYSPPPPPVSPIKGLIVGQAGNPTPADGLQVLVAGLMKEMG
jgi:hypothetical protein